MTGRSLVSWTRCPDYDPDRVAQAVRAALAPLGGLDRFVHHGDKVFCKCNLLVPARPDQAVSTHPEVLRAVIREVKRCGGVPIVGDNSASTPLKLTLQRCGLLQVCLDEGAEVADLTESVTIQAPADGGSPRDFEVSRAMLEAEVLLNLPKLKTHALCTMTLATKNLFGFVPGLHKARWHLAARSPRTFSALVVDLYAALLEHGRFKGRMVHLLDGILGMEGEGPGPGGTPRKLGILMASEDAVAIDRVACHAVGLDVLKLQTCTLASERGLGQGDLSRIELAGGAMDQPLVTDWKVPAQGSVADRVEAMGPLQRVAGRLLLERPVVALDRCTGCGQCSRVCAAKAIEVDRDLRKARVNLDLCIRCYCCAEVCPDRAVKKSDTPMLGRLMGWRWGVPAILAGLAAVVTGIVASLVWWLA